ncbi:class I SAM-dependent methyltransferase [Flavobacterium agricola]|uniref:Class I SAM-dependent methyltransferase n=1 Tax=Flavobacterium agricola TaxID=2870839 RepID=A0ABY6M199_9FLAO|nr:class I SAM-dependent methyltransferase [Flavobacterium agricola]UYW02306.1 class I SAM-dependent methyltransferase [Flavobacterium agricola]
MIQEIAKYWDKQSEIWREEKEEAWSQPETEKWLTYFKSVKADQNGFKVLEIGTASGYFANILHLAGYEVTAVDVSPNMIKEAKEVSAALKIPVTYHVMDAQHLDFENETFDLVFTRLMTWTIPDLNQFYSEAFRVLKNGGVLLNMDGDFGKCQFSQEGHEKYPEDIMEQANQIKAQLAVNTYNRPIKDVEFLEKIGFTTIVVEADPLANAPDEGLFTLKAIK